MTSKISIVGKKPLSSSSKTHRFSNILGGAAVILLVMFFEIHQSHAEFCIHKTRTPFHDLPVSSVSIAKLDPLGANSDEWNERYVAISKSIGVLDQKSGYVLFLTQPVNLFSRVQIIASLCDSKKSNPIDSRLCRTWMFIFSSMAIEDSDIETLILDILSSEDNEAVECR